MFAIVNLYLKSCGGSVVLKNMRHDVSKGRVVSIGKGRPTRMNEWYKNYDGDYDIINIILFYSKTFRFGFLRITSFHA